MAMVFTSPPSLYKNPIGTAVGIQIVNGSPMEIVSIVASKVGTNTQAALGSLAQGLGGTAQGAPGSLSQYMRGLGIIVGVSGSFNDSVSVRDGAAVVASIDGTMNTTSITGLAFNQTAEPSSSGSCSFKEGHGIERILAYFQDNRMANITNEGRWTVIKIGKASIDCKVIGVSFELASPAYNVWGWTLSLLAAPTIRAGDTSARL